jgi:hypothetical protein|tara:strand:+ start:277 stop:468 length:192 start_codon:yes stop_codon:yes gene_type:complete
VNKFYTCKIIEDPDDSNELAIDIPEELLSEAGFVAGDTIFWEDNGDDSWTLSKVPPDDSTLRA